MNVSLGNTEPRLFPDQQGAGHTNLQVNTTSRNFSVSTRIQTLVLSELNPQQFCFHWTRSRAIIKSKALREPGSGGSVTGCSAAATLGHRLEGLVCLPEHTAVLVSTFCVECAGTRC